MGKWEIKRKRQAKIRQIAGFVLEALAGAEDKHAVMVECLCAVWTMAEAETRKGMNAKETAKD